MTDPSEEFIKDLVKQLPVKDLYDDSLKKPAKEIGDLSSDLIKVISLALAPIQYLAALQDRYRNFLDQSVRRVPEKQRIRPAPQILGPVLEGIKYEPDSTIIHEMFSQLLSSAMNSQKVEEAHPSYPILIKQLSPDEALFLTLIKEKQYKYIYTFSLNTKGRETELDEFPKDKLRFKENFDFYFARLHNLGLVDRYEYKTQETVKEEKSHVTDSKGRVFRMYSLTGLGKRFMQACTENDEKSSN